MRLPDGAFCHEVGPRIWTPRGRSLRYTLICAARPPAGAERPASGDRRPRRAARRWPWTRSTPPRSTAATSASCSGRTARAGRRWHDKVAFRLHASSGAGFPRPRGARAQLGRASAPPRRGRRHPAATRARQAARAAATPRAASSAIATPAGARASRTSRPRSTASSRSPWPPRHGRDRALARGATRPPTACSSSSDPTAAGPGSSTPSTGRVVEPYEVYSVHQDAMAPMALLELSEASGDAALPRGGAARPRLGLRPQRARREMLDREAGILYRSIRRRSPVRPRAALREHGARVRRPGRRRSRGVRGPLEVNPTDRPYHLGWILEAWAGRETRLAGTRESPMATRRPGAPVPHDCPDTCAMLRHRRRRGPRHRRRPAIPTTRSPPASSAARSPTTSTASTPMTGCCIR